MSTPIAFPSPEWVQAYKDAINANPNYKTAAKDWTHGVVAMVVKAEPTLGLAEDQAMWLDVDQGVCRAAKLISRAEAEAAAFVIEATYAMWKQVIRRELDPIKAMMQGKLKVTKGLMPTLVKYVHSNRELVESASRVSTKFLGE